MRRLLLAVGGCFADGFILLLPVLISYLLIGTLFDLLLALTVPIADVLPSSAFNGPWGHRAAAAGLLAVLCLAAGLLAQTWVGDRLGRWVEGTILDRFPPYVLLRRLSRRLSGSDMPKEMQLVLVSVGTETRMLALLVEEHPDGNATIFVPLTPTPGVGFLLVVGAGRLQQLDTSLSDALGCIFNWGLGTADLVRRGTARADARPQPPGRSS